MTEMQTAPPIEQVAPSLLVRVREGDLGRLQATLLGLGLVLLVGTCAVGATSGDAESTQRFYLSYLTAFAFTIGIQLGALVFTMIQHVTRAGWSVVVRRLAENVAATIPWMLLLFIPIVLGFKSIFHAWADPEVIDPTSAVYDHVIAGKSGWLDPTFFFVRVGIYFAIWIGLATYFRSSSIRQDETGDPAATLRMSRVAAPGILLFALSITFAAFDWVMSLNPHWFSTIFGVTFFSGAFMAFLAFLAIGCKFLASQGYLRDAVTTEHYHDIGKLLFAFMVFWTYTNFSQYMLIWYANLPEETAFFAARRSGNGWGAVGTILIFGHFLVPFAFLMSRHVKRNTMGLIGASVFMLLMHWIDMQYLILPNAGEHGASHAGGEDSLLGHFAADLPLWLHQLRWYDFSLLLGMFLLLCGATLIHVRRSNLLPTRDPRLSESLSFQNF
ncbi:MAG: hypothetical protein Fur0037_00260 [Planctomycetota bacterium]